MGGSGWTLTVILSITLTLGCKKERPQAAAPQAPTTKATPVTSAPLPQANSKTPSQPTGVVLQDTESSASGIVIFGNEHPVYTIARDYGQVLGIAIHNISNHTQKILADVGPWDEGMIGGFGGDGGVSPIELSAGQSTSLLLHLYAQDAIHPSYRSTVTLTDAGTGAVLAKSPITVFVTLPSFSIHATVGDQDSSTLARSITVRNTGQTITDFSVRPDSALAGQVQIKPTVDHTLLEPGAELTFKAEPVLATDYTGAKGALILSGAGQTQSLHIDLPLPPGKHVFVATSFTTTSNGASSSYCTNNPNSNTPVSGPSDPDDTWNKLKKQWDDPHYYGDGGDGGGGNGGNGGKKSGGDDDGNPFSNLANWLNSHLPDINIPGTGINTSGRVGFGGDVGPVGVSGDVGAAPGSDPSGPIINVNWNVNVDGQTVTSGQTTVSISQSVQNNLNPNSTANPTGSQLSGVDYGDGTGSHSAPRGLAVREAYARFRPGIFFDNEPEAFCDSPVGDPVERMIFQVWHSGRWTNGKGRQILLRIWDGLGKRALSRTIALSSPTTFSAWPTVLFMSDRAALLAVWETVQKAQDPPSLAYRVGGRGFGTWSPIRPVPGADSPAGNYDPQALLAADGQVLILWQQGRDKDARLMLARSDDAGSFTPVTPTGLPPGVQRPVARIAGDGSLCIVFQAPPPVPESGVQTAVFAAVSHDRGNSFQNVIRLSPPQMDAGEPDLLLDGQHGDAAYRVGPSWGSQIYCAHSDDGTKTWSASHAVTEESHYAEYPVLTRNNHGAQLSYYGDLRANRSLPRAGSVAATQSLSATTLKQFALTLDPSSGNWSPPRRMLTHFPSVDVAWLEVEFALRFARAAYQPHDVTVLVNDRPVMRLHNAIPEGTYLVGIPSGVLAQDGNGVPHNVIGLRTVHMNPGHYLSAANFRLQARQAFSERLVVADTQEAADAAVAAETDEMNHSKPDVGIFARPDENPKLIPAKPASGQIISLPLSVANIGQSPAHSVTVRIYPGDAQVAKPLKDPQVGKAIEIGTLGPLDVKDVDVTFPYGGAGMYSVIVSSDAGDPTVADSKQLDFDLANNIYRISFVPPQPPVIQPRAAGTGDFVADLDDDPSPAARWRIIDPQTGKDVAVVEAGAAPSSTIPPGKYQLALQRYAQDGKEIMLPGLIERKVSEPMKVTMRTVVELQAPAWVPMPWQWHAILADHPDQIVQFMSSAHPVMLLPPGDYFIETKPSQYESEWVRWPQRLHLEDGQHLVLKIDSGVTIPDSLAAQPAPSSWSLLTITDHKTVQHASNTWGMLCVPPGKYLWSIRRSQYNSMNAIGPEPLTVETGRPTFLPLPAQVELVPNAVAGAPYGFSLYDVKTSRKIASEWAGNATGCRVPPGDYQLSIVPTQYDTKEITWVDKLHLESNASVKILLNSGVTIPDALAAQTPPASWSLLLPSDQSTVQYAVNSWGSRNVPPGQYLLAVQRTQYNSLKVVFPEPLTVKAGAMTTGPIPAKVDLVASAWATMPYSFNVYDVKTNRKVASEWAGGATTCWLPPGEYRLAITPTQYDTKEITWVDNVHLDHNSKLKVSLNSGIDVEPFDRKEPAPHVLSFIPEGQTDAAQNWFGQWIGVLLHPGRYRVVVQQYQYEWQGVTWPRLVEVKPGELATLKLDSGFRITGLTANQADGQSFQVISTPPATTPATSQPAAGTVIQGGAVSRALTTVWIPPGSYSLKMRQGYGPWRTVAENVAIVAGNIADVKVTMPGPTTQPSTSGAGVAR